MQPLPQKNNITQALESTSPLLGEDDQIDVLAGQWAYSLRWDDLPAELIDRCIQSMVDSFGVGLAGSQHESFQTSLRISHLLYRGSNGLATVLGQTNLYDMPVAAWLNGTAMHALDFDDTSFVGVLHPSTIVVPALLALGEEMNASYRDFLLAYVAGVETELYLGATLGHHAYDTGHWTTASLGVVGAAVACGKLLGLSQAQLTETIRLALHQSAGMRSVHGSLAKAHLAGMASRTGLECALAVQEGLDGGKGAYIGQYGYLTLLGLPRDLPAASIPGEPYRLVTPGISFKQYPLCSATQAAIDALLILQRQHRFDAADIDHITCYGTPLVVGCLKHGVPENASQAQFSMPFALATAAIDGTVSIAHLKTDWLANEQMRALASKVRLHQDDNLVSLEQFQDYPEAARVIVTLKNGDSHSEQVLAAAGMPKNPISSASLNKKFIECAAPVIGHSATELYRQLHRTEDTAKVKDILKWCAALTNQDSATR